jgi:hypothetical protein
MNNVWTLLTRCYALGAELFPAPDGKLKVRAPAPLPDELREALRQCKPEVLAVLRSTALTLRCQHCRCEALPDGGTLSKDRTNYIQWWRCLNPECQARGSTVFRLQ